MDKFLVKTPRAGTSASPSTGASKKKQVCLRDLKRVVNIDDIKRYKTILEVPGQTRENIIEALKELKKKIPPRHVFTSTRIGKTVKKLRKSSDQEIKALACDICSEWNEFYLKHQEKKSIEVRCDTVTTKFRSSAMKMLSEALGLQSDHVLVKSIEQEVFHQNDKKLNNSYKKVTRTIVLKFKNNSGLRKTIIDGTVNTMDFVKSFFKKTT